jgi:hypothetical protein
MVVALPYLREAATYAQTSLRLENFWLSGVISKACSIGSTEERYKQRRRFLKTAAAAIPCAGLHDVISEYAHAEAPVPATADSLHVVSAGEDRFNQPTAMVFSTMLFKVATNETAGGLFIIEHKNLLNAARLYICTSLRKSGST